MNAFNIKYIKKVELNLRQIGKELKKSGDTTVRKESRRILFDAANDTRNDIIKSMRNTPRQKPKWINWPNEKKQKSRHFPSRPGHPPAIDAGDMVKNVLFDAYDYKFIIGSVQRKPPYPAWLEDPAGNAPNAPYKARPWLNPAIERRTPIVLDNFGKVIPDLTDKIFRKTR